MTDSFAKKLANESAINKLAISNFVDTASIVKQIFLIVMVLVHNCKKINHNKPNAFSVSFIHK